MKFAVWLCAMLSVFQFANAGRPGIGTAISVGLGAIAGSYTEKQLKEAENRPDYKSDLFDLNTKAIIIKMGKKNGTAECAK